MNKRLKRIVTGAVPVVLAAGAGTKPVAADEVQSVAAQAIAQVSGQPAVPPPPPQPPMDIRIVTGIRP